MHAMKVNLDLKHAMQLWE